MYYVSLFQFEQFVFEEVHRVFDIDCLVTSHPIYVPVQNPDELNEIFDAISYSKVQLCSCFYTENGLAHQVNTARYRN